MWRRWADRAPKGLAQRGRGAPGGTGASGRRGVTPSERADGCPTGGPRKGIDDVDLRTGHVFDPQILFARVRAYGVRAHLFVWTE